MGDAKILLGESSYDRFLDTYNKLKGVMFMIMTVHAHVGDTEGETRDVAIAKLDDAQKTKLWKDSVPPKKVKEFLLANKNPDVTIDAAAEKKKDDAAKAAKEKKKGAVANDAAAAEKKNGDDAAKDAAATEKKKDDAAKEAVATKKKNDAKEAAATKKKNSDAAKGKINITNDELPLLP